MYLCHGFPGAEGQSMLGRVEKRRDRASCLGKGKGAVELRNQRGVHPGPQSHKAQPGVFVGMVFMAT